MFSMSDLRHTRVYQEALQEGIEQERRNTIMSLLRVRFGSINTELEAITPSIIRLSTEEFTPLLLQLSREELITRFGKQTED
ncbi:MAG: hypothetical protein SAJ12_10080 [Jaaginema sp. PMC 1079.18]|nr:hypothetical protein [Jaaginema sp. PMC 1080.18]MEC4851347.1 hypothetical protein [Jaaginema sp. PMC 1079.18]MEC4864701.1 hypothetical protein [Jaaginema sp. PMC 1078.18]